MNICKCTSAHLINLNTRSAFSPYFKTYQMPINLQQITSMIGRNYMLCCFKYA